MTLPPEIANEQTRIRKVAAKCGLDFFETVFEMVDWEEMNTVAAYEGFPIRYPHWRFGMTYDQISKSYSWGLSKIYELVINNDPCYAYLLRGNTMVDQKLVMAHVYAHCDFFKNNLWFAPTNRHMVDELASHATRIQRHIQRESYNEVEKFLDSCLSLDNLIDIYSPYGPPRTNGKDKKDERKIVRFDAKKSYMDPFINPPEFIEEQRQKIEEERTRPPRFPERAERDVLAFLMENAPLRDWQRDVLDMVREEAYYFAPQRLTKIMNEGWACLTGDARVYTDKGLVPIREIVEERLAVEVGNGTARRDLRQVYDWARFEDRETVRIVTNRGFTVEGSVTHRLMLPDGSWRRLDEVSVGDRVRLAIGTNVWPKAMVRTAWQPRGQLAAAGVARGAEGGTAIGERPAAGPGLRVRQRRPMRLPMRVDERLAAFLGHLLSDGGIDRQNSVVALETDERELAERFAALAESLFGLEPRTVRDGERWRVHLHSRHLVDFLAHVGCPPESREIPESILRSPKSVVSAFLRAFYDGAGCAGGSGVILVVRSGEVARMVQLLLANYGIFSSRRRQDDGGHRVRVVGRSSARFRWEIGFGLARKSAALRRFAGESLWGERESAEEEIVSVSRGRADVYDVSVETTHRYAAEGLIHHNSFWHSKMMTEHLLEPSEVIDFAERHAGAMAVQPGQINPYKLGIELFRDVEARWNWGRFGKEYEECDDREAKRQWDTGLNQGRAKIFEVRRIYNDVTFVDEFLTEDFCEEQKLFTYDYNPKTGRREINGRDYREIKDRLLRSLANGGQPVIEVIDANFRNRGELVLAHRHDGEDLQISSAKDTLEHLHRLWSRPVHIETMLEGRARRLSYDGSSHELVDL